MKNMINEISKNRSGLYAEIRRNSDACEIVMLLVWNLTADLVFELLCTEIGNEVIGSMT